MAGGRELWAIPKGLCDFTLESTRTGPLSRTSWAASAERRPVAGADFTDLSRVAPRVPFRGRTRQPGLAETAGQERTAVMRGTARVLPCRGRWDFPVDGPLGWLGAARPLASFRLAGFRLSFG
jgi:acetoacetate decarboxylase